jgi:hypothetical protein
MQQKLPKIHNFNIHFLYPHPFLPFYNFIFIIFRTTSLQLDGRLLPYLPPACGTNNYLQQHVPLHSHSTVEILDPPLNNRTLIKSNLP